MKAYSRIRLFILAALSMWLLAACEEPGPAERAGEAVDEAASDVFDEAEDLKEDVEERMED